ncbi:MAG: glycoside hydrolase family 3 C-terminal domain-containing protein [Treponema sp.]|nr:glycoside hydrolase family 3 C-terminal domain-containing protein [Treponema sp.]
MNSKDLVSKMTLEEKASLCSGLNMWFLKGIERLSLPSIMVTDGPHGLRKQQGSSDHLGINESVPATCFPTAAATASSFDTALLVEMGKAMGEECLSEKVAVILGPGVNIKRSPLCGRNFEYFSEDPYLSGELAAALISGIQSKGVGTSLKHYAANNQEKSRLTIDSVVDERSLREIYLTAFEKAVRQARPWTVMCSYNRLNGTYLSENRKLLSDILRDEWGFEGLVVTDWGAASDRVEGIRAGLDLEMPGSGGENDAKIVAAVQNGSLDEKLLDLAAERVTDLILKFRDKLEASHSFSFDKNAHHRLAAKIAASSAVLLENKGNILPLKPGASVAVIGALAKNPRYQGAGSSRINPTRIESPWDALSESGLKAEYAEGYSLKSGSGPDAELIEQAAALAKSKDAALIFAGLPDEYESEGFDRTNLEMPESHVRLIEAVAAANPNTVVLLQCGAPVNVPWADRVKAIVLLYLGGQAGGAAAADILTGKINPSGKLPETWPLKPEDNPSYKNFPGGEKTVEYREGLFVGYRWYDTAKIPVRWPFGFGLSYTKFEYKANATPVSFDPEKGNLEISLTVRNTGDRAGAEIVQLYIAKGDSSIIRPEKELKGFQKVYLEAGESKQVSFILDRRSFAYYNPVPVNGKPAGWSVEGGPYRILIGASSRDIRCESTVTVTGDGRESLLAYLKEKASAYFALSASPLDIPDADFEALLGRPIPPRNRVPGEPYSINSPLSTIKDREPGKSIYEEIAAGLRQMFGDSPGLFLMFRSMLDDMPLRSLVMFSGGKINGAGVEDLVKALNSGAS